MQNKIKTIFYAWKAHNIKKRNKIFNFAKALEFREKKHFRFLFGILKENLKKKRISENKNNNNKNELLFFNQHHKNFVKTELVNKIRIKILRTFFISWSLFIERKQKIFIIKRKVNNLYAFKLLAKGLESWKLYIRKKL